MCSFLICSRVRVSSLHGGWQKQKRKPEVVKNELKIVSPLLSVLWIFHILSPIKDVFWDRTKTLHPRGNAISRFSLWKYDIDTTKGFISKLLQRQPDPKHNPLKNYWPLRLIYSICTMKKLFFLHLFG